MLPRLSFTTTIQANITTQPRHKRLNRIFRQDSRRRQTAESDVLEGKLMAAISPMMSIVLRREWLLGARFMRRNMSRVAGVVPATRAILRPTTNTPVFTKEKSKKSGKNTKSSSEDTDDEENEEWLKISLDSTDVGKDFKDITTRLASLRLDSLLKAGLGLSNSKIESAFYNSRLRLNGNKVFKKSCQVNLGDEADVILRVNSENELFLDVMRVILQAVKVDEGRENAKTKVKLRRFKRLLVNNYPNPNAWKQTDEDF